MFILPENWPRKKKKVYKFPVERPERQPWLEKCIHSTWFIGSVYLIIIWVYNRLDIIIDDYDDFIVEFTYPGLVSESFKLWRDFLMIVYSILTLVLSRASIKFSIWFCRITAWSFRYIKFSIEYNYNRLKRLWILLKYIFKELKIYFSILKEFCIKSKNSFIIGIKFTIIILNELQLKRDILPILPYFLKRLFLSESITLIVLFFKFLIKRSSHLYNKATHLIVNAVRFINFFYSNLKDKKITLNVFNDFFKFLFNFELIFIVFLTIKFLINFFNRFFTTIIDFNKIIVNNWYIKLHILNILIQFFKNQITTKPSVLIVIKMYNSFIKSIRNALRS